MSNSYRLSIQMRLAFILVLVVAVSAPSASGQQGEPGGTLAGFGINEFFIPPGIDNAIAVGVRDIGGAVVLADGTFLTFGFKPGKSTNTHPVVNVWSSHTHTIGLQIDGTLTFDMPMILPRGGVPIEVPAEAVDLVDATIRENLVLGLRSDGTVIGWGFPSGRGTPTDVPTGLDHVVGVACNPLVGIALKADGTVTQWGHETFQDPPVGLNDVVSVAASPSGVIALKSDGSIVSWGALDDLDQLGPAVEIRTGITNNVGVIRADGSVGFWPDMPPHPLAFIFDLAISHDNHEIVFIQKNGMLPFGNIMPRFAKKLEGTDVVLKVHDIAGQAYQWKRDGVPLPGATQPWFFIDELDASEVGDYTVEMTNQNGSFEAEATRVELDLIDQELHVKPVGERLFGDPPFEILASASSGLPVEMTVEYGPATLDGNVVTITGNGTVRIVITQPGNPDYEPAEPHVIQFNTGSIPGPISVALFPNSALHIGVPWFSSHPVGVEFSPDLTPGSWVELGNFFLEGGSGMFVDQDLARISGPTGFYRAFLRPPLP